MKHLRRYLVHPIAIALAGAVLLYVLFVLMPLAAVRPWQRVETVAVRVTSSGTVAWGDNILPVAALAPELARSVRLYQSHGLKARLLIECYSDARTADVAALETIGHTVGFHAVDTKRLNWASPQRGARID